jgi:hypothetical protein
MLHCNYPIHNRGNRLTMNINMAHIRYVKRRQKIKITSSCDVTLCCPVQRYYLQCSLLLPLEARPILKKEPLDVFLKKFGNHLPDNTLA